MFRNNDIKVERSGDWRDEEVQGRESFEKLIIKIMVKRYFNF